MRYRTPLRVFVLVGLAMLPVGPCAAQDLDAMLPAAAPAADAMEPGATLRVWDVGQRMSALPELVDGQTPNISKRIDTLDLQHADFGLKNQFYAEVETRVTVIEPGDYTFHLTSDDGSALFVNGKPVISHDGLHAAETKSGTVKLAMGDHPITVRYFQNAGHASLRLQWSPPGEAKPVAIPTELLSTPEQVRVTSPGKKKVKLTNPPTGNAERRGAPGDGWPLTGVHPAYDLVALRPEGFNPQVGGIDLLSDGRLVVCTWDKFGGVYVLDGISGETVNPTQVTLTRIAAGLAEPLGLCVVPDTAGGRDRIFVLQKQELTELIDHDGDGLIDEYRCVSDRWAVSPNFREFAFGLVKRGEDFFAALAVAINPGGATTPKQSPGRGTLRAIDGKTGDAKVYATGFRTPNGVGIGPGDTIVVLDNQGAWRPASSLHVVKGGEFFGHFMPDPADDSHAKGTPVTPPAVWLPQGEIGSSPSEPILLADGPYAGQMLHGDVTHGGIKRNYLEEINGVWQGCVFRFSQGFEAGVNRLVRCDNGHIYVGCIGAKGNWTHNGRQRGLQKLVPNGESAFEMLAVRAMSNGFEVVFTQPVATAGDLTASDFVLRSWRYEPTAKYGGRKLDPRTEDVRSASWSDDRRSVFLEVPGLEAGRVVHVRLKHDAFAGEADAKLWTTEAWYTLNTIPQDRAGVVTAEPVEETDPNANKLTDAEEADGWQLLFDGQDAANHWRGFKKDHLPEAWKTENGTLARTGGGGDIITRSEFESFELKLQWKISEGGNSGIFFRVAEEVDGKPMGSVWHTGPEMQVLDNAKHRDGRNPKTSAGANYALHAAPRDAPRPVGQWNDVHVTVDGTQFTYRLNGVVTAEFDTSTDAWEELVAASKFKKLPHFAKMTQGHIALQDHGDLVWYRNIKIRPLPADE